MHPKWLLAERTMNCHDILGMNPPAPHIRRLVYRGNNIITLLFAESNDELGCLLRGKGIIQFALGTYTVYDIDTSQQIHQFNCQCPSKDTAEYYDVTITVAYYVSDGEEALLRRVENVHAHIEQFIEYRIRHYFRRSPLELYTFAEECVNSDLKCYYNHPFEFGLSIAHIAAKVNLNEATYKAIQRQKDIAEWMTALDQGQNALFAHQLAQNPDKLPEVIEGIRLQKDAEFQRRWSMLPTFVDKGLLVSIDISEAAQRKINVFLQELMSGTPQRNILPLSPPSSSVALTP